MKVNSIALAYGLDVIKWEEREISNLKNEVLFMKEREDYENRFIGDIKGLFRIYEVRDVY